MARLFLSLTDDEVLKFDKAREKAGMTRSQYLKFLLSGRRDFRPPAMRYRELNTPAVAEDHVTPKRHRSGR